MRRQEINQLVTGWIHEDGLVETGVAGVRVFRATSPIPCAPAVYEPSVIAIVSGAKEALLDGERFVYDDRHYMCCPISMPVQAGTPTASKDNPLIGVYISLEQRVMMDLVMEMEGSGDAIGVPATGASSRGIKLSCWDEAFAEALFRILQLGDNKAEIAVLGDGRLRELYYAILKGEAGSFARQAFGVGNAITRTIRHVASNLKEPISIDDLAARAGMSRAVFHRKFKQATTLSPIQFVKSMRLNNAAMRIAAGMSVNEAATDVGYISVSQFSREFRRRYGQPPRQWSEARQLPFE